MLKENGFQLIEMMIVVMMIGILSAIAYPCYTQHLVHAHRLEVMQILQKLAFALEEYHFEHGSYERANLPALGFTKNILHDQYELQIREARNSEYVVVAVSKKDHCADIVLTSNTELTNEDAKC